MAARMWVAALRTGGALACRCALLRQGGAAAAAGLERRLYSSDATGSGVHDQIAAINSEMDDFFGVAHAMNGGGLGVPEPGSSRAPIVAASGGGGCHATSPGPLHPGELSPEESHSPAAPSPASAAHADPRPPAAAWAIDAAGAADPGAAARAAGLAQGPGGGGGQPAALTHVDADGRATMVDVAEKASTIREAVASARVLLGPVAYAAVEANQVAKGDVLTVAQLAGIAGAKHTSLLIPLCHNIFLSKVGVTLRLQPEQHAVAVSALAKTVGQTGVEMEALTAASVAALTVYDMCKALSKDIVIEGVRLEAKSGGRSGNYVRGSAPDAGGAATGGQASGA